MTSLKASVIEIDFLHYSMLEIAFSQKLNLLLKCTVGFRIPDSWYDLFLICAFTVNFLVK